MEDVQRDGTFQRIQFGPARTLFALRVSEDEQGDRSCLYRIVVATDPSRAPEVEVLMDFRGWLTDFWRAEDKTFFLGTADGEVFVIGTEGSQELALEAGAVSRVFGRTANEVFVATTGGSVFRWDGNEWAPLGPVSGTARPGSHVGLQAVGELLDGRVVAAGEMGTIRVRDGEDWTTIVAPCKRRLTAIGIMQNAVYIGGERGACYRLEPELSLIPVPGPTYGTFGFATYGGQGYSASQTAGVMILNGDKLETFARPLQPYGIAVQEDLMVVHSDDALALFDGTTWRPIDINAQ